MIANKFPVLCGIPYYDEPATYLVNWNRLRPWEFSGWKAESLSWKTGCYIHSGLSDNEVRFTGPDVINLFESICVNNFQKFSIGAMKHSIACLENGLIASHAILQRNDEHDLRYFAGIPWPVYQSTKSKFRVEVTFPRRYLFQVAGPTSLRTLERATDEALGDINFLRFRTARIAGKTADRKFNPPSAPKPVRGTGLMLSPRLPSSDSPSESGRPGAPLDSPSAALTPARTGESHPSPPRPQARHRPNHPAVFRQRIRPLSFELKADGTALAALWPRAAARTDAAPGLCAPDAPESSR